MADIFHDTNESFNEEPVKKKPSKKKTVEQIYQKKSPLEHILIRPDTYVGSIEKHTTPMWVYDEEGEKMISREVTYVPALYKIFDEVLVNAADNKIRDPSMDCIKITIKPEENMIRVWNNGQGIPVAYHNVEEMYVPTMIFGHLLTSSNYDDTERKVTGGRNGYGAKLCNIFSKKFIVETSSKEQKKSFKQVWIDNMTKTNDPQIEKSTESDFTCVTFYPDLKRFGMEKFEEDIAQLYKRRAFDVAASCRGIKVFLNGKRVDVKSFKDYVDLFLKDGGEGDEAPAKVVYERINPRWEVAIAPSSSGFKQMSFVNSIATTSGGKHVDYVVDQVCKKLIENVKKKMSKSGVTIRPTDMRNHLWIFVNCLVENPTFSSQTKETMTLEAKKFGSACELSEKFIGSAAKCGIVDSMMSWVRFKAMEKMDKQCHQKKHTKLKGIPKLDDANDAGTKNSEKCTLILTEGDSAKSLAVAGLGVVGRDHYGVFPLRGKLLNVRDANSKQIMENAEITNLIKIMGLQYKNKYEDAESIKSLRYGKIMIMTDQDQDGSHIKGLLINFLHTNWPNLLKHNVVEEFITPIVKVFKNKQELSFYSLPEFEEWQKNTANWHTWRVKYYKGLGTSSSKEAKEYFSDMQRHRIRFRYAGVDDDQSILLAFSKGKTDDRKEWLSKWMEERKRRVELGLPEQHLYGKETHSISFHDFVHRELVLFSNMDNERSIPSLVDGLKPGQRKVLFTCFKRNLVKELKVAQLAGSVAELSSYHHGEASLMGTIIGLAQDFVGSNNVNLLQPIGQFGTRLNGGKDSASPRYIFTALNPITRFIFPASDDPLLNYLHDDNQRIEPEWYMPIVPMVLVNGSEGIGTGWSTRILNHDLSDVVAAIRQMLAGSEPQPLKPSFRGFTGVIEVIDQNRCAVHGEVRQVDETTLEITELPVRTWTQSYKEGVLEPMLLGTEKVPATITDYKEYHTDRTVKFVVKMAESKMEEIMASGAHKFLKCTTTMTCNSMVLFDHLGCIKRYESTLDILKEFFALRLKFYHKRKEYLDGMLSAEASKLENQARFVLEKIEGVMKIENKAKKVLITMLKEANYASDPVRAWREEMDSKNLADDLAEQAQQAEAGGDREAQAAVVEDKHLDYNYILNMPLWSLTLERKEDLLAQRDKKREQLLQLRKKTPEDLYADDLDALMAFHKKQQLEEEKELAEAHARAQKKFDKAPGGSRSKANTQKTNTLPNPNAVRIVPKLDAEAMKKISDNKIKAAKRKLKKEDAADKSIEITDADLINSDDEFADKPKKSLLERVAKPQDEDAFSKLMQAKPKAPAKPRGRRATEPATKAPLAKKAAPAKKKAKLAFSDSESESDVDFEVKPSSDLDESPLRAKSSRRAAAKVCFVESSDSDM